MKPSHLIKADDLLHFSTAIYVAAGLAEADARLCADTLVQADLWGHQSHGVMRLPWYVARLRSGAVKADAVPECLVDAGAIAVIDGHDAMGQVLAERGMRQAIRREIRLFVSELAMDMARFPFLVRVNAEDLKMMASLVVNSVVALTQEMLELDEDDEAGQHEMLIMAEKQVRLIYFGVAQWRSDTPPRT